MKMFKSMVITVVCALDILLVGYLGIIYCGEEILVSSPEPEPINITSNISNLFYSQLEDDIQLYPWNYYGEGQQVEEGFLEKYVLDFTPYIESDVFYTLISIATGVDHSEVFRWYEEQKKTILGSMVQGQRDGNSLEIYFYDDTIQLNGREYKVKIAWREFEILSFSCIQCREEGIQESKEWSRNKEVLMENLKDCSGLIAYLPLYQVERFNMGIENSVYWYVDMYLTYLEELKYCLAEEKNDWNGSKTQEIEESVNTTSGDNNDYYDEETHTIQVIEQKDSILLVVESDVMMGIYYDVIDQQVVGFHFF